MTRPAGAPRPPAATRDPLSVRVACFLYRWALRLALAADERPFRPQMMQTFRTLCLRRRREGSGPAVLALAFAEALDVARSRRGAAPASGDARLPRRAGSRTGRGNGARGRADSLVTDLRVALRILRRRPGFTLAALATLTVGIGSATAMFTVVDNLLIRPLPFPDADRLVTLWSWELESERLGPTLDAALRRGWAREASLFEAIGAFDERPRVLVRGEEPEQITVTGMTHDLFEMLGGRPAIGRPFVAADGAPGAPPVVLLSDRLWRRLGATPGVVGDTLRIDEVTYEVIGVMPPAFAFPTRQADAWAALPDDASGEPIGRLSAGLTVEAAQRRADELAPRFQQSGLAEAGWGIRMFALRDGFGAFGVGANAERTLWVMFGAVTLLLLIATANVTNLMLSLTTTRRHEIAVRAALGAGRARIARQLLIESAVLGLLGAVLGAAFALAAVRLATRVAPENLYILTSRPIAVDLRVWAFALAVALAATIFVGCLPALDASTSGRAAALRGGPGQTAAPRQQRLRGLLVVAEVAIAAVLLAGAGLLVRSMAAMLGSDPGFDTDVTVVTVNPSPARYRAPAAQAELVAQLEELAALLPGVEAAAVTDGAPPYWGSFGSANRAEAEGQPPPEGVHREGPVHDASQIEFLNIVDVTGDYFRTLGIPLLEGRPFTDADADADVAIISEDFARRYWHGASPVGRRLRLFSGQPWLTVVGVVPDVLQTGLDSTRGRFEIYYPMAKSRPGRPRLWIVLRGDIDRAAVLPVLRARLRQIDPLLPISSVASMREILSGDLAAPRFNMILLAGFATVALLLAAIGIYGVLAHGVVQRGREIGVRMALGARRGDVLGAVVGAGMTLASIGLALGGAGAWGLTRFMRSLLYEIDPLDPVTLVVTAALLAALALAACIVPALRATRVDPVTALRAD